MRSGAEMLAHVCLYLLLGFTDAYGVPNTHVRGLQEEITPSCLDLLAPFASLNDVPEDCPGGIASIAFERSDICTLEIAATEGNDTLSAKYNVEKEALDLIEKLETKDGQSNVDTQRASEVLDPQAKKVITWAMGMAGLWCSSRVRVRSCGVSRREAQR